MPENGEVLTVPARKANVVDTTGAGDTLNGAFSVRIAAGDDMKSALTYANVAASLPRRNSVHRQECRQQKKLPMN